MINQGLKNDQILKKVALNVCKRKEVKKVKDQNDTNKLRVIVLGS